ncbi:hypothetical protein OWV82_000907 [Melia azedarach]|uniref:Uncharacterized protein n=1 Tax=Melia azedarach TaxID=155640 RepID=A0ACC1YXV8_MELAZ|nr:hypothetical protein OWV82_000907 [Melia azedarach]
MLQNQMKSFFLFTAKKSLKGKLIRLKITPCCMKKVVGAFEKAPVLRFLNPSPPPKSSGFRCSCMPESKNTSSKMFLTLAFFLNPSPPPKSSGFRCSCMPESKNTSSKMFLTLAFFKVWAEEYGWILEAGSNLNGTVELIIKFWNFMVSVSSFSVETISKGKEFEEEAENGGAE